jgi:nucleoside-diphosphate kinase
VTKLGNQDFIEKSLVLIKPDAVCRGISGQIINRFERTGLKMVGLKIVSATKEQLDGHFPINDKSWIKGMGLRTLENYKEHNIDPLAKLGTSDPLEIGKMILGWGYEYLLSGPVVAIVFEGVEAISTIRKIIGHTFPAKAMPGTIRGDYSITSAGYSNAVKSACKNVVHASGNKEEAENECMVWFKPEELINYKRSDEQAMFNKP